MAFPPRPEIDVAQTPRAAAQACAARIVSAARSGLGARGKFSLALSGGSTPKATYEVLAADHARDVDWTQVHFFIGDERMVPYDDPRSNFGAARAAWLGALGLPESCLHPMPIAQDGDAGARAYERELRTHAPEGLDFVMLGLGDDGHTASLFPGRVEALPPARWVVAAQAPPTSPIERRLTLTFSAFEAAREVVFQVCGASKSRLVADILAGRGGFPAGKVRARESLRWILDAAAAEQWLAERPSRPAVS
ncbi:MAG TPA: 6-phosphogluconolactonase [Planctomycetota bacterium]|nr:6-phosphogluconolactonase [Planctomycetota bacterium]